MHRLVVGFMVAALAPVSPASSQGTAAPPPNVVLIITDDMGWADLGIHGARDVRTPNIDALARAGVRFTDFYANGVLCTPTRAGLMTGRYQQRYGMEVALPSERSAGGDRGLTATGHTLPRLLKDAGYATALVGKWHLGYKPEFSPTAHGFDYFFGMKSGYHDYYTHQGSDGRADLWENDRPIEVTGYMTDLITDRARGFIERSAGAPFFIDVSYNAPHWPYQPPDKPSVAVGNSRHLMPGDSLTSTRADYVRMIERVDRGVGEILATIDRLGIARNTIVIFTNDNGGEWLSDNTPFFNRKWTVWEGGIRVPAIVRWPGRIPAGTVTRQVGITMDLTASILAITGARAPAGVRLEGTNLFPVLQGQSAPAERTFFWRTAAGNRLQKAVRSGDWKLVLDGNHTFVFNVKTDLGERQDLAKHRQDIALRLRRLLADWERDVDAEAQTLAR